jgi:hypothetical protein
MIYWITMQIDYMARRKGRKAPRRRRSRDISLLSIAQSLAVGNIAMEGLAGTSIPQFIAGSGQMSLKGLAANPEAGLNMIARNAMNVNNLFDIAIKTAFVSFGFKFAKRALRTSVREINKPLKMLNLGVKL